MSETIKILLSQVPIFSGIPQKLFDQLRKAVKEKIVKPGDILFREGDFGDTFYVIKSGTIDILKKESESEIEIKLAERGPGDFFGEMALLEDSPRFATARASSSGEVLELARKDFNNLIIRAPQIALQVMGALSSRLRQADLQMIHDLEDGNRQLQQANQQLKSTNKFMETVISASHFFIIVTDSCGKIFIFNDAAALVFGYGRDEVLGKTIEFIMKPTGRADNIKSVEKTISSGNRWLENLITATRNGRELILNLTAARIFDDTGKTFATLYMGRDITEEKNFEYRMMHLDRMAARGEMAGEIAHEMNNYLAVVMGNLKLLQLELEKGKIDKAPKKISSMQNGLDKMTRFIDSLMIYSKPETEKAPFDLQALIENELFFIRPQNRFDGVELITQFNNDIPPLTADKSQIQQALLNLLNNAADATARNPHGQRQITITTAYDRSDGAILLAVKDNGAGLSDDVIGRLFREHFTTKERGHGFGLMAVKRVVENHAGKIWVESNPQGGAIFNIKLPIAEIKKTEKQPLLAK